MTDDTTPQRPSVARRLAAAVAILLVAAFLVSTVLAIVDRPIALAVQVVLLAVIFLAVWNALTRDHAARLVWIVVAAVTAVAVVLIQILGRDGIDLSLLVLLALLGAALVLARYALGRDVRSLKQSETPGKPVPAARHGVLIMNLKSGGGKAEKFHLVDECRARGIEPVVLQRGDDLLVTAKGRMYCANEMVLHVAPRWRSA